MHHSFSIAEALEEVEGNWDDPENLMIEVKDKGVVVFRKEFGEEIPHIGKARA